MHDMLLEIPSLFVCNGGEDGEGCGGGDSVDGVTGFDGEDGNFSGGFLEGFRAVVPREGACRLRKSLESEP